MGGGVRSQNWRDGWEGGTDGTREGGREGCDGNYEVDPVHMAWNGCIILTRRMPVQRAALCIRNFPSQYRTHFRGLSGHNAGRFNATVFISMLSGGELAFPLIARQPLTCQVGSMSMLKFHDHVKYRTAIVMFKLYYGKLPTLLQSRFKRSQNIHNTRNRNTFTVRYSRTNLRHC